MPLRFTLLKDRFGVLLVGATELVGFRPAADVAEKLRLFEILALAGGPEELHEANFNLFMAGRFLELAGAPPEGFADQLGILESDLQERALAGGLEVRDRSFVEMPYVVELVAALKLRPPGRAE